MPKGRIWTKEEVAWLKHHWPKVIDPKKMAARMGRSYSAVRQKALLLGLTRDRHSMVWPPDRVKKLRKLYPDHTNEEIARKLGTTEGAVNGAAYQLGLRKSEQWKREVTSKSWFPKGHIPQNKGRKWDEYMSKEQQEAARRTCFKKGAIPPNHKPVGWERKSKDGYWLVKIQETGTLWERWRPKHILLWEQHHGPIPKGVNIVFIDGNKDNITIENLRAETMVEKFNRCCSIHTTLPPELRELVQLKGALRRQLNKLDDEKPKRTRKSRKQTV